MSACVHDYNAKFGWGLLVELRRENKKPVKLNWNTREVCERTTYDADFLKRVDAGTASVGLALSYSGFVAIDVDDIEKARPWFAAQGVDLDALMNAPDAVRRESGRPNRTLLLYRSEPLRTRKVATAGIEFLCATSQGLTVQIAIPPSVNPKSLRQYEWKGDWRNPPLLPESVRRAWESVGAADVDPERKAVPPDEKGGAVGAICRAYDPREEFPHSALPALIYELMCQNVGPGAGDRHAYLKAVSGRSDGLLVLPDGAIQIFDATFPGGGVGSMNIFDFMRLALLASEDSAEDLKLPVYQRPSYKKLLEALQNEPRVREHWQQSEVEWENLNTKEGAQPSAEAPKAKQRASDYEPIMRCADDIPVEKLQWVWPGVLALGYPTLFGGDPGVSKSTATVDVAARISNGVFWPCSTERAPIGDVLFITSEDRPEDVIIPRLQAAGANLKRIHFLEGKRAKDGTEGEIDLGASLPVIEEAIRRIGAILVIVDPVSEYEGDKVKDSHNNSQIRALLKPVRHVAVRRKCAFLLVTHFTKDPAKSGLHRFMGSIAYVAACRAAFAMLKDKDDPDFRLLLPAKANLSKDRQGFRCRVVDAGGVPKLAWDSECTTAKLDDVLAPEDPMSKKDRGMVIIQKALAEHLEMTSDALFAATKAKGIGSSATYAALRELRMKAHHPVDGVGTVGGKWVYSIPETDGVRRALADLTAASGKDATTALLQKYSPSGALKDLPPESYDALIREAKRLAKEAGDAAWAAMDAAEAEEAARAGAPAAAKESVPKARKPRKKPAESEVSVDLVERATAAETARHWFDDIQSEATEQPAAAEQSASKTVTPDVVPTPTPAGPTAAPAPTMQPTPAASDGAAPASNGHDSKWYEDRLAEQIRALPDHAFKLVKGGIKTTEQVAQASDAAMRDCGIHSVYAKTLKNAANRWLQQQRAAGGGR